MPAMDSTVLAEEEHENNLSWKRLNGSKLLMGCVLLDRPGSREPCYAAHDSTIVDALNVLNVTYDIIPLAGGMFAKALRNGETDIVITGIGISADRYKSFDFAINTFRRAFFYVKKKWRHRAEVFLGGFPLIILLALSIIVSVSFFAVLNASHGKPALKNMGNITLALIAATLSLSSPLRGDHAHSTSSGFVMACWMLACFSLTTYTRSLLTASLMARPTWEADDTLEKMLPKLQRGRLLPCAESYSFFDALLSRAGGNGTDVVDVMARAAKRWAHSREDFTGNITSCLQRTRKGTHVLFTASIDFCYFLRLRTSISPGQKPIQSIVGGFPIRKDYPLRGELIQLLQRIFETGWDIRLSRLAESNCSALADDEENPLSVQTLLYAYCACCAVSSAAFFAEYFSRNLCVETKKAKRMPTVVRGSKCRLIVVKPAFRIVTLP
ncbi:hypothetical protein V5799_010854 [Amblyomma americanum]|uniref:Uncharacterized protein n=1 Tax=Amblyomma americanum TaxID=6943 RepID=A0AAQ4EIW0_AMBAM